MKTSVIETHFAGLSLRQRGKVRDIYDLGDSLLMIATDRISAFDVVMPDPVPDKGKILTQISLFWFDVMKDVVPNHVITSNVDAYPNACKPYADTLRGRSMLVKKAAPLPVECVVRGYLSGSGWKSYQQSRTLCGIHLPDGLTESDRLPDPIFTPSTKEEVGIHDQNISFDQTVAIVGPELAATLRDLSITLYSEGARYAETRGIIIADTKFEFGVSATGEVIWIDEALTPDSSRFWPMEQYRPGGAQPSYDKQYVRDFLLSIKWNKTPPAPRLPEDVISTTSMKYVEALKQLTGRALV